ncbi:MULTISPECIES: acyl-homoserine-lactone synthase [Vibrio]|uniref:acyl-homoserine-lactone synthase n=1 Tax=Vibrio TaxID=662 RepID=UPI001303D4A6|nr:MULTISPECIES: acyl-homoserine-lactone synthase [Vibrio]ELB2804602.1 acyl-homoserine-lactone synthase [Vibrio alginolyticus]ELB2843102.1 acyl-homoserine-lactone synthase [Vibrio alginolyticus]ELB2863629.1 acyl-homoserine-lactone synthase [Vibrio alginolyticus]ELU8566758.1 acyl-homoserine-lactone synthase [Vibrio alginolyticus]MBO0207660.1 acyl-homoserine-lactone synthase [Vibrio sp. Vb0877]
MSLEQSLEYLTKTNLPIESKQQALVDSVILTLTKQKRDALFQQVALYRIKLLKSLFPKHASKSLSALFELMDYRDLVQQYPTGFSKEIRLLEQLAADCYPHWMVFWCQCEIEAIKQKYPSNEAAIPTPLPFDDHSYTSVLIKDIADCDLEVMLPNHAALMPISEAITLSNLELFVQTEQWFEILPLLSLSQKGQHFALLLKSSSSPIMVSSALVQGWHQRNNWLSYSPQFSNEQWQFCFPNHGYSVLNQLGILECRALTHEHTLIGFDAQFQSHVKNTEAVCEVLRLTVGGNIQQKLYFLYLAQKTMMSELYKAGYKLGFTIIEQVFMLNFYQSIDLSAYFHSGYRDINGDGTKTYRGFWNLGMMVEAFQDIQFRDYKHCVRTKRMDKKVNEHA